MVAVDYDMGGARSLPEVELYSAVKRWIEAGFQHAGADPFVGMRFPVMFEQAGLIDVGALGLQTFFPSDEPHAPGLVVGVVRALKEAILDSKVVTETELGLETLEDRLSEAVRAAQAVWTYGRSRRPSWARRSSPKPSSASNARGPAERSRSGSAGGLDDADGGRWVWPTPVSTADFGRVPAAMYDGLVR